MAKSSNLGGSMRAAAGLQSQMMMLTNLHGHETKPGEVLAGAPARTDEPQQNHAEHEEHHHNQTQPQLQPPHKTSHPRLMLVSDVHILHPMFLRNKAFPVVDSCMVQHHKVAEMCVIYCHSVHLLHVERQASASLCLLCRQHGDS